MAANTAAASSPKAHRSRLPGRKRATPPKRYAKRFPRARSSNPRDKPYEGGCTHVGRPILAAAGFQQASLEKAACKAAAGKIARPTTNAKSRYRITMTRYQLLPLDLDHLHTVSLQARGGKVKTADFAIPYHRGDGVGGLIESLPRILAGEHFRAVIDAIFAARENHRAIIWGLGGHVIKCGLAPILIDLMRRGYATAFAMNGSASIHDFEIALAGHTSEDVEAVLPDGRFGAAEETGREMNRAIAQGDRESIGIGEALGAALCSAPHAAASLLAQAYSAAVPVTVHVAMGTDTPHN